jgi:hypothetical protein
MTLLMICFTHNVSWDMDADPPQCDCLAEELELQVIEDEEPT